MKEIAKPADADNGFQQNNSGRPNPLFGVAANE
jgi:hypothetical protein